MNYIRTYAWHIVLGIFFVALVAYGALFLESRGQLLWSVSGFDFVLMALAITRLVRLFTYDAITGFIRHPFVEAPSGTFRGTVGALLSCPWCAGLWFAPFVLFAYLATPYAYPVIVVLALAGLASFFQILANLVGWRAEAKKLEVQGKR